MKPSSVLRIQIAGIPKPQGSKKAFSANGRAMMKEAGGLAHAAWRNAVAEAALRAAEETRLPTPLRGPLAVSILYRFPMPASRPKAVKEKGIFWKTTAPDVDKLDRAIGDGLMAGGLIGDDALICVSYSRKVEIFGGWTGALVVISELSPADEFVEGWKT